MVKKIQILAIIGIIVVLLAFFIYSGKVVPGQSELVTKTTTTSSSMCWNSLNQTCGGSCSSQNDCQQGYICISRECPFAYK